MPLPVELDIAVGVHENRAAFRGEWVAQNVDPLEFVSAVQQFVRRLLAEGAQQTPVRSGDTSQPLPVEGSGLVVSAEGDGADPPSVPSPEAPPAPPVARKPRRPRPTPAPEPVEETELLRRLRAEEARRRRHEEARTTRRSA